MLLYTQMRREGRRVRTQAIEGDVVGLLLDLDTRGPGPELTVYLNGEMCGLLRGPAPKSANALLGPVRWAIDVGYNGRCRVDGPLEPLLSKESGKNLLDQGCKS